MKILVESGNTGSLSNSSNPPGSNSTSQNGDAEHVEETESVLHAAITGKDIGTT